MVQSINVQPMNEPPFRGAESATLRCPMSELLPGVELDRWRALKVLKGEGLRWGEIATRLQKLGLLSCPNCSDPAYQRRNLRGETTCTTCETKIAHEWKRNLAKLSEDEADILEVKWAWLEAHEFIARTCRERHVQKVHVRTIRRTWIEPVDGATWNVSINTPEGPREATVKATDVVNSAKVVTETVREEMRIYPELLRLLSETRDKINRARGVDMEDPETLTPVDRKKTRVNRPCAEGHEHAHDERNQQPN